MNTNHRQSVPNCRCFFGVCARVAAQQRDLYLYLELIRWLPVPKKQIQCERMSPALLRWRLDELIDTIFSKHGIPPFFDPSIVLNYLNQSQI